MAGNASRLNGLKGGRPKGTPTAVTVAREKAREYLVRRVEEEIEPIADKLIEKAQTGDVPAIKELFDRAWGKSKETQDVSVRMVTPIYGAKSVQGHNSNEEDIPA